MAKLFTKDDDEPSPQSLLKLIFEINFFPIESLMSLERWMWLKRLTIISEILHKSDFHAVKEIDEIFEQDKITREQTIKTVNSY